MMKTSSISYRRKLEKQLDSLWRTIGKETAECEICRTLPFGSWHPLEAHHIIHRTHQITRWDLRNRLWVCSYHHTLGQLTVHDNLNGWFWGAEKDWLGLYRPDDKLYLEKMKCVEYKKWTIEELEKNIKQLESYSQLSTLQ